MKRPQLRRNGTVIKMSNLRIPKDYPGTRSQGSDMVHLFRTSLGVMTLAAASLGLGDLGLGGAAQAANGPFLAHQALYDLSLVKSRSNSVNSARGRILYNFTGSSCEGYTSEFRQVSELDSGEGKVTLSDLRSNSWEDAAGKSYRFKIETRMNEADAGRVDGSAERDGDHINVKLKLPAPKSFTLDGKIVFPTEQIQRIIAAAKDGKPLLELSVYDGSDDGQKVYNTLTVIGQPIPADRAASPDPSTADEHMKSLKRWPVTVSYFDREAQQKEGEQTPVYAMSFELYENGVSRQLMLDYNDFVISGAMGKFDVKDSKPCN
ncbi:DUF1849 domain-containing protein [Bradyrhizobium sp. MOS003]|nr:DUF1849 domain-containing protein [Bradyrhizobium sp. MOS003]